MPELAEVDYFRRRWNCGIREKILRVDLHNDNRVLRGNDVSLLKQTLTGSALLASEARGKQMLFRFSKRGWLGIHLGMTGHLRVEPALFTPGKHDHLVLRQRRRALVFNDARQFGRILFHHSLAAPDWWTSLPPALTSNSFTVEALEEFLRRHAKAPIKAVLLDQARFPGVGNWMADEILWRAGIHPCVPAAGITNSHTGALWKQIRFVCEAALRVMAQDHSDPPASWLFQHRWEKGGFCPKDGSLLRRAAIGGRTTAWCPRCQRRPGGR
jgi:formamidopyrimidine-DNA glycosylase